MTNTRLIPFTIAIASLTAIDLATKWWAVTALSDDTRQLPGPVDLRLHYNRGTAFGLFSDLPAVIISIATVCFITVLVRMWLSERAPGGPVALIVAGGLANVIDRVEGGGVVDMLHTGWWPTFNLADVFITVGVAWWISATTWMPKDDDERVSTQTRA